MRGDEEAEEAIKMLLNSVEGSSQDDDDMFAHMVLVLHACRFNENSFKDNEEQILNCLDQVYLKINSGHRTKQEKVYHSIQLAKMLALAGDLSRSFTLLQLEYAKFPEYGSCLLYT